MTARRVLSPLGVRLVAAFVTVAVSAVVVFAALTLASSRSEVAGLVNDVHEEDAVAAAAAAARSYERAGGWQGADLSTAAAVAARGQASFVLRGTDGEPLAAPIQEAAEMMARMHGVEIVEVPRSDPVTAPVVVDGDQVGTVALRFPTSHLPSPQREVRNALTRNAILGALLAIASAVAVAVFVARRVGRPIHALTDAVEQMEGGRRDVTVDLDEAPGELGALAAAFDRMSASLALEDQLRRRLVSDVAHELRTPLAVLQGTTEAFVDGVVEPDAASLGSLHEEVLRLGRLVADLETLASADAAHLHLHRSPVDLAEAAGHVVEIARPATVGSGQQLLADLRPAPVLGDEPRLRQVVTTLLANALAYTPTDGTIAVTTGVDDGDAVLRVSDDGPGIHPEDLPRLFDRFYRGRRTADVPGSGIGLSVARELVVAHDGSLTAGNRPEGGAVFEVRLRAEPRVAEAAGGGSGSTQ